MIYPTFTVAIGAVFVVSLSIATYLYLDRTPDTKDD